MEINKRIRFLRKEKLHLTQEELGEPLGLTRANIANIEANRVKVTERVIISICEKFNVEEKWLRNGEGEPLVQRTRNQEVQAFTNDAIEESDESFKKRFLLALSKLDERDWEAIEKLTRKLNKETKKHFG